MKNPKIPAMHFNTRFIVTKKSWFGGGIDLTPSFKDRKEEIYFHSKLKELCNNNKKIIISIRFGVINTFF